MRRSPLRRAAAALAFWLALSPALPAAAQEAGAGADDGSVQATLHEVEGEVTVFYHDREGGVPAEADMPLEAGDRLKTAADSRAEVTLDDGAAIELGPDADFTVEALGPKEASLSLTLGSLWAKVQAAFAARAAVRVRTANAVAAVRGTEFAVEQTPEGETHVGVYDEGKVAVSDADSPAEEVVLEPNREVTVRRGRPEWRRGVRPLERFLRHRARMERLRRRAPGLWKRWKRLPPEKRRELRRAKFDRRLKLKLRLQERRRDLKRGGKGRPRREERRGGRGKRGTRR